MSLIFLYHGVISGPSDVPPGREEGAHLYDLNVAKFQEHMDLLSRKNVSVGILSEMQETPPEAVISFDDGEENNLKHAFPVLSKLKFPAYFFITVNRIGKKGYLNWEQIKELRDANMVIGSHSLSHAVLTELKKDQLERELVESKDILERELKVNVDDFSVPRGFCDARIIEQAKEAGYKRIFVSDPVPGAEGAVLPRIAVKSDWTGKRLEQALQGKTPIEEAGMNVLKSAAKKVLGSGGYNNLRKGILKDRFKTR